MTLIEIAKKFGVSRHTIYNTLKTLELTKGYSFTKGKKGAYELTDEERGLLEKALEKKGIN